MLMLCAVSFLIGESLLSTFVTTSTHQNILRHRTFCSAFCDVTILGGYIWRYVLCDRYFGDKCTNVGVNHLVDKYIGDSQLTYILLMGGYSLQGE